MKARNHVISLLWQNKSFNVTFVFAPEPSFNHTLLAKTAVL